MPGDMNLCSSSSTDGQIADLISSLLIQGVKALLSKKQEMPETMTLYYRLTVSPTDSTENASRTNFATVPVIDTFRGMGNRYMVDSDFVTPNKNIITFVSMRTPENLPVFDNNMYNETVCINVGSSFIQGVSNYVDNNNTFETIIPYVDYSVTTASGIFKNFNNIRINFYNDKNPLKGFEGYGPIRTVVFTCP